ncbi:MAG: hypothetical protein NC898_03565 [Candidatus Omnitrophica bacterium]|nr:hypothetical protein [Candidatus Omnitrophota bacterium]MCM8793530.1 hypothetical protein [Candidatus Omnitrophota bacterium]
MEIKFYEIKKVDLSEGLLKGVIETKGAPKGVVKVVGGKLYIKVKDKKLERMLNQPYAVRIRERKKRTSFSFKTIIYKPGNIHHLKAFSSGCWQFGYLAEIKR